MKTAIVVFSDPKAATEEALGRFLNSLILTWELKEKGQEVALIFQGAGTRWVGEVVRPEHPAHALYGLVEDKVVGVCGGCADVFGARQSAADAGARVVRETMVPGTTGVIDLSRYLDEGYRLVTL
jgi:hypothetical protein